VEVTCAEARAHLGMATPRQWSAKIVARTTPCELGLYWRITLLAERVCTQQALTARRDTWYAKERVTCSDTMAMVRRWQWTTQRFQLAKTKGDPMQVLRALFERLTKMLCYVA
jgi:hypothetical protein